MHTSSLRAFVATLLFSAAVGRAAPVGTTDLAGNPLAGLPYTGGETYILDALPPDAPTDLSLDVASDSGSAADSITSDTTPTINGAGEIGATVRLYDTDGVTELGSATVQGDGAWSITTSGIGAGEHLFTAKQFDAAGNSSSPSIGYTVIIDISAPAVSGNIRTGAALTNASSVQFTVTFNESVTGVDAADFSLATTGSIAGASVTNVSGSGASYTVTASTGGGSGTLKLDVLDDDSILDVAGNPTSTGHTSGQDYTVDKSAPTVSSIVRQSGSAINSGASDLTFRLTFDQDVTGVDLADFAIASADGDATGTLASVAPVSASIYDVSINQVSGIGQLSVSLNNSGTNITDLAGNAVSGGYAMGESYLVGTTNVLDSLSLANDFELDVAAVDDWELAQPFKTSADGALTVYRVAARIGAVTGTPAPVVTINADENGAPGEIVAVLNNPAALVADSVNVWTTATVLAANTSYWLVFSDSSESSRYFVAITSADSGGLGNWFAAGGYSYGLLDVEWVSDTGALHVGIGALASPAITSVMTPSNARYRSGQALDFTVNYDAAVTVDDPHGSPRIPLTIGSSTVYASYQSGSPGTALVFRYTVQAGDNDADGIAVASPIDLNGSTIKGAADVDALLTFAAVDTSGILIDNTAPAVSSVSVPSAGTYVADQNLDFTLNFSENVTVGSVGGTPRVALTIGSATAYAVYHSGSGTAAITFRYTVQVNDLDADSVSLGGLEANGGTLRDLAGSDATLTLNSVGTTANVFVDAVAPTIASMTAPAAAHYRAGQALLFTVNFTENITVNTGGGTPLLALTVGATSRYADYVSGSGTSALVFSYTVQAGETDDDGIESGTAVASNGGTLRDPAGNNAALNFSAPSLAAVRVDTAAPTTSITAPSASLTRGGPVTFQIDYADAHFAGSTLSTDGVTLNATGTASGTLSVSGSGAARTVTVSSITGDGMLGISIAASTATDEAGNAASVAGPSTMFAVDNTAPTLTAVGIASNNTDTSRAKTGDVVTISFSASETIVSPTATIAGHAAQVTNPTGNNWIATATLEAGDNAGTVVFSIAFSDLAGNAATAVTTTTDGSKVAFDGAVPALTSVAIASNNAATAWAKVGDDVVVNFTANETIATPTATIAGRAATIAHADGNTWTATVSMTSGDTEGAVGFSISFSDLSGNPGTTVADVTDESSVTFDKTAPAVSIGAPSIGLTNTGPVTFTATYSDTALKEVTLANGDVTLNTNDTATADVVVSGTGNTRTITLTHIAGDGTLDITLAANTASDMAGNLADASSTSATFNADNTAPVVMMIGRQSPITINNDAHTLTWRLIFAEDVTGVDVNDLVLTTVSGTSVGEISNFTPISASTYDVVVDEVSGRGQLRIDLKPSGTAIEDTAGNPLADGGFTKGDFYITGVLNVFQTTEREVDGLAIVQHSEGYQAAQRFTTAADAPLTLTTVTAWIGTIGGAPTPLVTIHAMDSSGGIGELVTTLENPSALVAGGMNAWTSSQLLEANTTYWVVFADTSAAGSYEIACSSHGTLEGVGSWLGQDDYLWRADVGAAAEHNGTLNIAIGATSVPVITSTLTASGMYGSAFAGYSITATELPDSYRATGLPTGLSLDEATGFISGTPAQSGTFNIALTAINASGEGAPSMLVLEIEKAPLLVTADAATRTYGAVNPTFTVSYTGFVNGDTAAALITPAEATSSANITSVVGTYDIVPSGGSAANYMLSYANGTLTVTKATAAIAFSGLVKSYTGMALPVTAITDPADLTLDITYDGGTTVPFMPGSYPVVATIVDANYQGSASGALVIGKIPVAITLNGLSQIYTGATKAVTASITPAGLPVTLTYNGSETAPTDAGEYEVHVTVETATHAGSATDTLTVEKATQSIAFTLGQLKLGSAATLAAIATSGLPVSFELIDGPATLNGATLTPTGQGSVTVRATQSGNSNYFAADAVDQTVEVTGKLSQTITFAEIPARSTLDGAFRLSATASSGLSVTFKILSGPASLAGRSLIPAGTPGTVIVQASQAGNDKYAAADDVVRSFEILAEPDRVFFGNLFSANAAPDSGSEGKLRARALSAQADPKVGDVAAVLPSQNKSGSLLIVAPSIHINALVSFTLAEDNTFTTTVQQGGDSPATRTVNGELSGTILSGEIEGTGLSFATEVESESGPSAEAAGLYRSAALETAQGTTYTIIGSNNNVLVLAVTSTLTVGGPATLDANGSFELQTPASNGEVVTLQGAVDTPTTTVAGTILVPSAAPIDFAGLQTTTSRTDRLLGLSSRGRVGAGEKILISGVVIGGSEPKPVLIRAIGPALGELGVANTLVNPRISLFQGSTLVGENDNWATADNADEIEAAAQRLGVFGLSRNSKDAALLRTLAPGAYTVHVDGGEGVALVEVYDASENPQSEYQRLVDIATRGEVGTGENVLIGGLAITGNSPKRVLVRGVGPGLAAQGVASVLADPVLRVYRGNTVIGENDNWDADATQAAQLTSAETATGAFHLETGSKDAAILLTLAPGNYTVHVSGANNTTGVALVEIYEVADEQ